MWRHDHFVIIFCCSLSFWALGFYTDIPVWLQDWNSSRGIDGFDVQLDKHRQPWSKKVNTTTTTTKSKVKREQAKKQELFFVNNSLSCQRSSLHFFGMLTWPNLGHSAHGRHGKRQRDELHFLFAISATLTPEKKWIKNPSKTVQKMERKDDFFIVISNRTYDRHERTTNIWNVKSFFA